MKTKRTTRNNKSGQERNVVADGVYSNGRYMHAVSLLVGCTARVTTANGSIHEGVFRTFSEKFEIVLEVAHKVGDVNDNKEEVTIPQKENVIDVFILKHSDIVACKFFDVDLEYASRDSFIDTGISKFNGEIRERDLEPWDGCDGDAEDLSIEASTLEGSSSANGWDPNEMFKTNAEQYGVQSSYDNSLSGYTTSLQKKNTDEYRKAEARANKIAGEIEGSAGYKARIALENVESDGEEERFGAVIRPTENSIISNNNSNMKYAPPQRRKNHVPGKPLRPTLSPQNSYSGNGPMRPPQHMNSSSHPHPPPHHRHPMTSPPPPRPQIHHPMSARPPILPSQSHLPSPANSSTGNGQSSAVPHSPTGAVVTPRTPPVQGPPLPGPGPSANVNAVDPKINGDKNERERKPADHNRPVETREVDSKSNIPESNLANNVEQKPQNPRAREENVAELKKFSSDIKIAEEPKEESKPEESKPDVDTEKNDTVKKSTLNPNAKEFVFNPSKSIASARSPNGHAPPAPTPPRTHTPGAMVPAGAGMSVPIMSAPSMYTAMTPGPYLPVVPHMQMASAFGQPSPMQQTPRYRKPGPGSVQPRHDFSPSIQAVAATGQPLLAPAAMHPQAQFTVQYATPTGVVHSQGGQQQTVSYPQFQLYSVIPHPQRMVTTPQGMTMVQSHNPSYPEQHVQGQIYLSAHPGLALQAGPGHSGNQAQQVVVSQGGVHNHSGQHQQPPTPTQPNPPAGNPQQHIVYQSAHTMAQPPHPHSPHEPNPPQTLHSQVTQIQTHNSHMIAANPATTSHGNHANHTQTHPHSMQTAGAYGNPQTVLLISQQHPNASNNPTAMHPHHQSLGPHQLQPHQIHPAASAGQHNPGQMPHLMSHPSMPVQVIPVSSGSIQGHPQIHYIPHPQAQAHPQQVQQNYQHNQ